MGLQRESPLLCLCPVLELLEVLFEIRVLLAPRA